MDITGAVLGICLSAPVMAGCAVAIKIDSRGPVLFRQKRLGRRGEEFTILKLRTMKADAEMGGVYETNGDPRVTSVGRFLRQTSLDEVPQLINILRGEMSFVGPRPTLTYHPWALAMYTPEQARRFDVRPGITGLAQINGRKELPWTTRLKLDTQYVDQCSFSLDAAILAKTSRQVLLREGNLNRSGEQTASDRQKS